MINKSFTEDIIADKNLQLKTKEWVEALSCHKYVYQFEWMGRPIIQLPQDIMALQEIIWSTKPDLIIETGIAHGGSLIFYASMLKLLENGGEVLGIDVDIREHNRQEIEKHALSNKIRMIQGSSIDINIVEQVKSIASDKKSIMVVLDSNHTHDHVLSELRLYSPLVSKNNYLIVFDTLIEDMPDTSFSDRPWGKDNNPKTAVWQFLKESARFEVDYFIQNKLLVTTAPDGYLKCIKD